MTAPEPTVRATRFEVSCLPEDDMDAHLWALAVEYRGRGRWAVVRDARRCLGRDGAWSYESLPSERADEWLTEHRFPLGEALELAKLHAPTVRINGRTPADYLAWAAS